MVACLFSAKVELELASFLSGRRDMERRQDNLDRVSIAMEGWCCD